MIRFNKLASIFSFRFWKQSYHLFTSFLVGNVWSQTKLGQIGEGVDINPTVRFGNYQIYFWAKYFYRLWHAYIRRAKFKNHNR